MKVHVAALKWDSSELYRTVIRGDDKDKGRTNVVQLNLNYHLMAKMLRNGAHLGDAHDEQVRALMASERERDQVWTLLRSMLQKKVLEGAEKACRARENHKRRSGSFCGVGGVFWDGIACWIGNDEHGKLSQRCPPYIEGSHVDGKLVMT